MTPRHLLRKLPLLGAVVLVSAMSGGCSTSPQERGERGVELAASLGWQPLVLQAGDFAIQAFVPEGSGSHSLLTVYIEGDGLAWLDRQTPSLAPTPADPLALRLAMADGRASAAYLARPCQYTRGPDFRNCHPRYWTSHRFAPELLRAMDLALDQLQQARRARRLMLVGYSGGAAVAALLAARRQDVVGLVTVAGVLDAQAWTQGARMDALSGSLDPRDVAAQLTGLPQWHFLGADDRTVPPRVIDAFLQAQRPMPAPGVPAPVVRRLDSFDHRCCWVQAWPGLRRTFAPNSAPE